MKVLIAKLNVIKINSKITKLITQGKKRLRSPNLLMAFNCIIVLHWEMDVYSYSGDH